MLVLQAIVKIFDKMNTKDAGRTEHTWTNIVYLRFYEEEEEKEEELEGMGRGKSREGEREEWTTTFPQCRRILEEK